MGIDTPVPLIETFIFGVSGSSEIISSAVVNAPSMDGEHWSAGSRQRIRPSLGTQRARAHGMAAGART